MIGAPGTESTGSADEIARARRTLGLGDSLLSCELAGRLLSAHRHLESDQIWLVAVDGSHVVAVGGSEPITLHAERVRFVAGRLPLGAVAVEGAMNAVVDTKVGRGVWLACVPEDDVVLLFRDQDGRVVGRVMICQSIGRSVISRVRAAFKRRRARLPRGSVDI